MIGGRMDAHFGRRVCETHPGPVPLSEDDKIQLVDACFWTAMSGTYYR